MQPSRRRAGATIPARPRDQPRNRAAGPSPIPRAPARASGRGLASWWSGTLGWHAAWRAVLGSAEDADDAAQDAMLSALVKLDQYDARRPFGPWLLRIVANAATDRRRRRSVRRVEPLDVGLTAGGPRPDTTAERRALNQRLREALAELPERRRLAVVLFDVEGYSHGEIAAILGIPEGTVRSEVFHARRRLRVLLADWKEEA